MNRTRTPGTMVLIAAFGACCLWAAGPGASAQDIQPSTMGTPGSTPVPEHVVEIQYLQYAPDPVEVKAGERVAWVNRDALPHTVTARNGDTPGSEPLALGESYMETFAEPGTYDYFCLFHAQMHGVVVVTAAN